jgi:hypothetical protein
MKADLGEAGQNLLIPRWQQQIIRGIKTGKSAGNRRHNHNKAVGVLAGPSVPGRLEFKMVA